MRLTKCLYVVRYAFGSRMPPEVRPTHIVVGGGSAGCVIASRLSEDPDNRVLLVEAGPKDHWWNWKIHMPSALMFNLRNNNVNWYYHTQPERFVDNRVMYWPRGKVLGGSSALNAMAYVRGHAFDYDRWAYKENCPGWSYAECLPYFKKAETYDGGADEYRGGDGPLHVHRYNAENQLYQAFIQAGAQAGYPLTKDMNGLQQEGFGVMDATIHRGIRCSASRAYIRPILKSRKNLYIETRRFVQKIVFGKRREATAIVLGSASQYPNKEKIYAEKEIILCGGAINSPQLLQLSGIGDADLLRGLDIDVVQHLPGVGRNLQDHLELYIQYKCKKDITLYNKSSMQFPLNMIRIGTQWMVMRTGLGASAHLESGAFVRSNNNVEHPMKVSTRSLMDE